MEATCGAGLHTAPKKDNQIKKRFALLPTTTSPKILSDSVMILVMYCIPKGGGKIMPTVTCGIKIYRSFSSLETGYVVGLTDS